MSVPRAATIVPSSACDGERYDQLALPSVVTWCWPDPFAFAIHTLWLLT